MTRFIFRHRCIHLVAGAVALLAFAALAPTSNADETQAVAEPTPTTTPDADTATTDATAPTAAPQAVDFSGMIVQIDPATGRMRPPTAEEAQALSRALARRLEVSSMSAASHTEEHLENGAVMVELDPSFHDFTVARRAADGTLVTDCVHGSETAHELAQAPVEAPAVREEK